MLRRMAHSPGRCRAFLATLTPVCQADESIANFPEIAQATTLIASGNYAAAEPLLKRAVDIFNGMQPGGPLAVAANRRYLLASFHVELAIAAYPSGYMWCSVLWFDCWVWGLGEISTRDVHRLSCPTHFLSASFRVCHTACLVVVSQPGDSYRVLEITRFTTMSNSS